MKLQEDNALILKALESLSLKDLLEEPKITFSYAIFEKGEFVAFPSKKQEYIFIVVKGQVQFYAIKEDGKMIPVNMGTKGTIIGDTEFVGDGFTTLYAEAVSMVECVAIPIQKNKKILDFHVPFLHLLLSSLSKKVYLMNSTNQIEISIEEKLNGYLQKNGEKEIRGIQNIAAKIGCSRRHLERIIKKKCELGELIMVKKGVYVKTTYKSNGT